MNIQDLCLQWGIPFTKIGAIGELSDGYHTFNDLYRQRCILFAALCNTYPNLAWKSRKHSDGQLPFGGGWFIVGIDTPEGSYTYHYELKDWDLFKVEELDVAKMWDGHTDKDVDRLLSLIQVDKKRFIGIDSATDSTSNVNVEIPQEEESTQSSWTKREIEIACRHEREGNDNPNGEEWNYGVACYESALKAFESLCKDGHSGMSIGFTKNILNRLIDGQPLTPIEDTPDIWSDISDISGLSGEEVNYQCKRMSSLFKYVYADGTIKYKDVNSCYCVNINSNQGGSYHSGLVQRVIDEMFPITMPYSPGKSIKVYCDDFLTDHKNGDFDTVGVFYAIKDDETIQINRYFKEDRQVGWMEIDKKQYEYRKELAELLKEEDAEKQNKTDNICAAVESAKNTKPIMKNKI